MESSHLWNRREFIGTVAAAAPGLAALAADVPSSPTAQRFQFIAFSKAFQELNFEDTADLVAEVGWDGIECPVRRGGHVLPERVEEDLPRLVEALAKRGKSTLHITTDILDATDPIQQRVLRTASKLGVRVYRLSWFQYRPGIPLPRQIAEYRARLKDLAALNKELGLCGGYQNHSGENNVGAPVWDIYQMLEGFDPKYLAICFDIGHATVEGGNAWALHARLMEPQFKAVYVKDFTWQKQSKGWQTGWCPLGEGMVSRSFFDWLMKSSYGGIISQHHEYPLGPTQERVQAFKKDLVTLKALLA
jgi:sugar phosphate isomerase/epimerase